MKMLLPTWNYRVSPVFDVAKAAYVYESCQSGCIKTDMVEIAAVNLDDKFEIIKQLQITYIVCGAISNQAMILARNLDITVLNLICGDACKVSNAWIDGSLERNSEFFMPAKSCCMKEGSEFKNSNRCMKMRRRK